MTQENIMQRAEITAKKLRRKVRTNGDPLCNEANKAIMALLGLLSVGQCEKNNITT